MKKTFRICLAASLLLTVFLTAMAGVRRHDAALAARIAPQILRFHVIADSDSAADQAVKLEIRDLFLNRLREANLPDTKDAVYRYIVENREVLERELSAYLAAQGFSYQARIRLETCEFPEKTYGDMTFPAGEYEAVRVVLGSGRGQNFWCVLYPSLCYLDSTHAVVPDQSKETLKSLLLEDDFQSLLRAGHPGNGKIKIRFRLAELFGAGRLDSSAPPRR
ncbi:MAG: stage II sporulation protein R [Lachnospiraceae bacterium]|nr:stage II sporulation protein R [Lachnospiraceae bacterium]